MRAVYSGAVEPGSRLYKDGMRLTGNEGTALHWAVRGFMLKRREVDLFHDLAIRRVNCGYRNVIGLDR